MTGADTSMGTFSGVVVASIRLESLGTFLKNTHTLIALQDCWIEMELFFILLTTNLRQIIASLYQSFLE
jgi:hypothetical protein